MQGGLCIVPGGVEDEVFILFLGLSVKGLFDRPLLDRAVPLGVDLKGP